MKYIKTLSVLVSAVAALMAFVGAGSASATTLTSPPGTHLPAGTEFHAVSEETWVTTSGFKNVECKESTMGGKTTNAGGPSSTVSGVIEALTVSGCNCEVKIISKGSIEIHAIAGTRNGTLTSTGLTETVNCDTIFGKVHCNYETQSTDLGTLTGSSTTGATATMDIKAEVPWEETNSLCAEDAIWHIKYKITTPGFLDVS